MQDESTTRRVFLKRACAGAAGLSYLATSQGIAAGVLDGTETPTTQQQNRDLAELNTLLRAPVAFFRPTVRGATLHWVPNQPVEARVWAGSAPSQLELVREFTSDQPSAVLLDGFKPDAEVFAQCAFRRKGERHWLSQPVRRFHTARPSGRSFSVALIADSHQYGINERKDTSTVIANLQHTMELVLKDRPDFVVFLGDEAGVKAGPTRRSSMSAQGAQTCWASWRKRFAALTAEVPSYMVLGNHEGEAGFHQCWSSEHSAGYYQRWGTIARKRWYLNPLPGTYREGGEDDGWQGEPDDPATGGADAGNCSPLQNYYAWTWGDALFIVLDVHRYTRVGSTPPERPEHWTLGEAQMKWLEKVLTKSQARWKFVVAHHVVGGYTFGIHGDPDQHMYSYGRGGARYARVGEQTKITELMKKTGAQCFLYGHDHVFADQQAEGIHFVCCGRPSWTNSGWWSSPGWREAYGDVDARNPHDFYAAVGYTRLVVSPREVCVQYVRSGTDSHGFENVTQAVGEVVYETTLS
ncbi:MAG: hypothetical protein GY842_21635 [bacterium]|nr:hypothetical protein [bacterium]